MVITVYHGSLWFESRCFRSNFLWYSFHRHENIELVRNYLSYWNKYYQIRVSDSHCEKKSKLPISQILRETNFGPSKISKATILTILQGLNFHFGEFFKFLGLKMPIYKFLSQSILREIKFPHFRAIKTLILTFSKYLNFNLRQFHFSPLQIFTKVNSWEPLKSPKLVSCKI